jgi:hypothetical protein
MGWWGAWAFSQLDVQGRSTRSATLLPDNRLTIQSYQFRDGYVSITVTSPGQTFARTTDDM